MKNQYSPLSLMATAGFVSVLTVTGLATLPVTDRSAAFTDIVQGEFQAAYSDRFASGLPFSGFATSAVGLVRYAVFGQATDGAIVGKDGWLFTAEDFEVGPGFARNIATNAAYVADVSAALAARDIDLFVTVLPDKAEIYSDKLGMDRPRLARTRRHDFVRVLKENGVTAIDASAILHSGRPVENVFVKDDTHWTPFGAELVSLAVADKVKCAHPDLTPATVQTQRHGLRDHDGDLLNFIPVGEFRPYGGPAQLQIEHVETLTTSEGGLFGDVPSEVVLIGTSYSDNATWNFSGFLEEALQTPVLNLATSGQGPFAPMQQFLASDTVKDPNLKAVIWEIPARYVSKEY